MRLRSLLVTLLPALSLALAACSNGTDVEVTGLWKTQIGTSTVCRVFCSDGLTLDSFGGDPTCTEWNRPEGRLSCFPYGVDGDQLEIGGDAQGQVSLSADAQQLTWNDGTGGTFVYSRLADTAAVCSQPCYRAGNADEPLRP